MTLSPFSIDLIYLALYVLEPVLKLAAGALIAMAFGEGLVHAVQILRRR